MLSVNQMFYGTEEPVWLVDGSSPSPVKYHYLGSAQAPTSPPLRPRDSYYDSAGPDPYYRSSHGLHEPPVSDPYFNPSRRDPYSPPRSRRVHPPSLYRPPPVMPYSSANPPPAPMIIPVETAISHTPVLPIIAPTVPKNTPYTLLLKVPICCEGCEKRIVKKLLNVDGVMSVRCDIDHQRVTVRGVADTDEVLKAAKKAFKKSRLW